MALHIVAAIAIAAIVVPLLLLLLYALADALKLPFAGRILDIAYRALMVEFAVGTVVNVLGGLAIIGLGIWGGIAFPKLLYRILSLILVPYGAWRMWRGIAIWLPAAPKPQASDRIGAKGRRR